MVGDTGIEPALAGKDVEAGPITSAVAGQTIADSLKFGTISDIARLLA
jgi:hypothetical protein